MAVDLTELMPVLARLDRENRLAELDAVEFPETGVLRWLFGLNAEFHFPNDEQTDRRAAMIELAEGYYDRTDGRCNHIEANRGYRLRSRDDIRRILTEGAAAERYWDRQLNSGFYIAHLPSAEIRSGDPVHDKFSALLPGVLSQSGHLLYQTRLRMLHDSPQTVVGDFIETCSRLGIFYAVQGVSVIFGSISSRGVADAYPLLRRFPGLLFSDPVGLGLGIENRNDIIRDVNWLTAIDDAMLARIGGAGVVRAALSDAVVLHPFDGGMVFQAGPAPRIGDVNAAALIEPYREVNALLRPLRFEDWGMPYLRVPDGIDRMQATEDWIRRFD
ncbi:MAG: DUF3396 domain-containing protein [Paracoccus sp. (in: a-proteobacteria)]|nr:DUF3396 domain-containing protein [Paracoccus sp. (in: a-proteobacteria)]